MNQPGVSICQLHRWGWRIQGFIWRLASRKWHYHHMCTHPLSNGTALGAPALFSAIHDHLHSYRPALLSIPTMYSNLTLGHMYQDTYLYLHLFIYLPSAIFTVLIVICTHLYVVFLLFCGSVYCLYLYFLWLCTVQFVITNNLAHDYKSYLILHGWVQNRPELKKISLCKYINVTM